MQLALNKTYLFSPKTRSNCDTHLTFLLVSLFPTDITLSTRNLRTNPFSFSSRIFETSHSIFFSLQGLQNVYYIHDRNKSIQTSPHPRFHAGHHSFDRWSSLHHSHRLLLLLLLWIVSPKTLNQLEPPSKP